MPSDILSGKNTLNGDLGMQISNGKLLVDTNRLRGCNFEAIIKHSSTSGKHMALGVNLCGLLKSTKARKTGRGASPHTTRPLDLHVCRAKTLHLIVEAPNM